MRALEPEVVDAVWAAVEALLPLRDDDHPLGCHRPRVPDRLCFRGILIRLVTGASWIDGSARLGRERGF
jgi:transposase